MGNINIAIDGPAGAGKSTVAKLVSQNLGLTYLDTGAMYRAIAYKALNLSISFENVDLIMEMLQSTTLDIEYNGAEQMVILDGQDITSKIRTSDVSNGSSLVAKLECVRRYLVEKQREIAMNHDVVMDGRDIGSYVLPHAKLKVFLTASVDERAKRRFNEFQAKGQFIELDKVKKDIEHRDWIDKTREFSPLIQSENAKILDTTDLTVHEVAEKIIELARYIQW